MPIAVAIMAHRTLREASDAGMPLAVFTSDLTRLLWVNTTAAELLGLSAAGPQSPDATPNSAIIRQIRASGRMLARTGSAKARVTPPARAGLGRPLNAELVAITDDTFGEAVLVTIADPSATPRSAAETARDLLAESGMTNAAVLSASGDVAAAGDDAADVALDASQIAEFLASADDHRAIVTSDGSSTVVARLAGDHVLAWTQSPSKASDSEASSPDADADEMTQPVADAPEATAPELELQPPEHDRKIGMSAILQRWYFRNTGAADAERTQAAEQAEQSGSPGESESMPSGDDRMATPAETPGPGPQQPYGARSGHSGSIDRPADAAPSEPRRMRSIWGPAPTPPTAESESGMPTEAEETAETLAPAAEEPDAVEPDVVATEPRSEAAATDTPEAAAPAISDPEGDSADMIEAPVQSDSPPAPRGTRPVLASDFRSYPDTGSAANGSGAAFEPRFDVAPVRFVWRIDSEGRFRSLSPEFAAAVGPRFADVIDRRFEEVAEEYGLDADGDIRRLLAKRDTWSGRTLEWPVENSTRRVPVELAALPVYARDRSFDGFRGFGIVRLADAVEAPVAVAQEERIEEAAQERQDLTLEGGARALLKRISAEEPPAPFGRRDPDARPTPETGDRAEKIIRLEERRRSKDGHLSQSEEAAFRAIGETLGDEDRIGGLEGAIRTASRRIGEFEDEARDAEPIEAAPDSDDDLEAIDEPDAISAGDDEAPTAEADDADDADDEALNADSGDQSDDSNSAPEPEDANASMPHPEAPRGIAPAEQPSLPDVAAQADDNEPDPAAPVEASVQPAEDAAAELTVTDGTDEPADPIDADEDDTDEPELPDHAQLLADLATVYGCLPLPVLVQIRETLVYGNREFFDLTGYDDIPALAEAGGLARLFDGDDRAAGSGEVAIRRVTGETLAARSHMQRSTIAGRSCLVMSFFASPSLSAAALRSEPDAPPQADAAETDAGLVAEVEELQAVLSAATDGVVLVDRDGMIRSMNRAAHALFGIGADDAAGRPFVTLLAHESQKPTLEHIETLRTAGAMAPRDEGREVIGRVAEGGFVPLSVSFGRLPEERGWCAVIRDISRAKRVEQELIKARSEAEAASLQKSQFLANVSHELRTPLNAIIGFADVIATECFGPIGNERYLEYLDDIKRSGHHVLDLVNDLLDISKIEAGKLELAFEAVSLNEVIGEVVALMQPQANREQVIVRSNLPSSVPPVVADRRSMRQIALNLVSNAVRFTPAGGQIIVSTSYSPEGDVVVRFRDSGIGMSEDEIEIAMMPFQQVNPGNRRRGEGTGLGLPLTKALAEANRAGFAMSSTPGEGTLVEISFPPQRVLTD
ncbi:PAS domain S-box protein [Aurantimonas coralicida]|uniref:PAS domain S-box protein n=1 Tax=Aurantimonas coralicida TaxID=182270 RepID=UPI001D188FC2|nr:PAS domain S-box protein [Aurantimonas coralicida]MCC4299488.1 PAS domain S-box protein [Aurantimonas coralicida]